MELLRFAARCTADAAEHADRLAGRVLGVDGTSVSLPAPRGAVRASVTFAGGRFASLGELAGPLRDGRGEDGPAEAEASI